MLKKINILIALLLTTTLNGFAQNLAHLEEAVFTPGEELDYKLKYGFLAAADGKLSVEKTDKTFNGQPSYHLVAKGKTTSGFSIFYKVDDRYDSYIDKRSFLPYYFKETIREGKYRRNSTIWFDQNTKKIVADRDGDTKHHAAKGTQTFDLLSCYYFSRMIDTNNLKVGQTFSMIYFLKDESKELKVTYAGKEVIKTKLGKIRCLKFNPEIDPGRIFKKDSKLYLWVTDDGNRIPVKAEVDILIGSISMELYSAKGLKYALQTE
ncbi:DUF3108 domain-containing protein [Olivibacter sitiensis]|uniref:DUF3108 domain-containing protein n=1 Tax=Olivibacter sitiensis TaxID=376470 RepID=UPI00041BC4AC|nr:DUF3108 domain-containing protein [Olivibacter sitiensis]